jgi:signal transduction histidine kinase
MRRLYFRIYLAVLASLVVFALVAGLAAITLRSFDEDDRRSFFEMGADIAERMLDAGRGTQALQSELEFWRQLTGFSIMLLSPSGETIAEAGEFPPQLRRELQRGSFAPFWRSRPGLFRMTLNDGRRLVALRPAGALDRLRYLRWAAALIGIALAVGIAAYPIVRQLTRRLERLQQGVAAFGEGNLAARVSISGHDEIAKLAETFNASAARIEQLLNAHRTLLANASHELRSPLSRLRMAVEKVGAASDCDARSEIQRNITELDALVEEILLASRLQAGTEQDLRFESVDLLALIAEECAPYGADLSAPGGVLPLMHADPRLLRRLFRNLLENAVRYGGNEAPAVSTEMRGGCAQVMVCDRGPGVPEDEREKIFEPFYRLRSAPESAGGAGLGLALVRQIAERHGGDVRCLPREGGGTCFSVTLPLSGTPAKAGAG